MLIFVAFVLGCTTLMWGTALVEHPMTRTEEIACSILFVADLVAFAIVLMEIFK